MIPLFARISHKKSGVCGFGAGSPAAGELSPSSVFQYGRDRITCLFSFLIEISPKSVVNAEGVGRFFASGRRAANFFLGFQNQYLVAGEELQPYIWHNVFIRGNYVINSRVKTLFIHLLLTFSMPSSGMKKATPDRRSNVARHDKQRGAICHG